MNLSRLVSKNLGLLVCLPLVFLGCSSDVSESSSNGGAGGVGGSGGVGGAGGSGGGGSGGTAGTGATGGGSGGTGGSAGGAGTGGSAGGGSGGIGGGTAGTSGAGGAGGASGAGGAGGSGGSGTFTVTSPAFETMTGCSPEDKQACDTFPTENTNYGTGDMKHISPELVFSSAPAGTQGFAVVFQDLSNGFAHWVIWNIPGSATGLAENLPGGAMPSTPAGASQASIDSTGHYFGPGAPCNVYEFVVYALNQATISPPNATDRTAVRTYIQGLGDAILGEASIRARSDEGACN